MNNAGIHARLVIVAAIWGLGWPAGRVVAAEVEPITAAWIRYVMVVALFLGFPPMDQPVDNAVQATMEASRLDWLLFHVHVSGAVHERYGIHCGW